MGIGSILGTYGDFVLGTGQSTISKAMEDTIKYRKAHGFSYGKAFTTGITRGVKKSHTKLTAGGGFFKSLKSGLSAIPNGWKTGKGFFGKPWGAIKGCGKAMPVLFAGLTVLGEIPNVYKAVRDKGVVQGLKEVGKTATRLTTGAIFGTVLGAVLSPIPGGSIVGGMGGWMLGDWIASKLVGKSYSEQIENKEGEKTEEKNNEEPTEPVQNKETTVTTAPQVDTTIAAGDVKYPSVDINDFGPYRPYDNVFFNNPIAYSDFGATMPNQTGGLPGFTAVGTMMPMMGMGTSNNTANPNLLAPVYPGGGNLLNTQNAYNKKAQPEQGSRLDLNK